MTLSHRFLLRMSGLWLGLILLWLSAGCQEATPGPTPIDPAQISTQAAGTVIARFTQAAGSQTPTFTASPTIRLSDTPTSTPSSAPSATPTATPQPTETPVPSPTPSETPLPCNQAQFLRDVTIPDNTQVSPGSDFIKTWQLRNTGDCIWNTNYEVVFVSGESFEFVEGVRLQQNVFPGDIVNVSAFLTAPDSPGFHRGGFMLRADDGTLFGVGTEGFSAFWVQILVVENRFDFSYDFATNFCLADWESQDGRLPCPGRTADRSGFVVLLQSPTLESHQENEPAIWSQPVQVQNGWIRGTFPAVRVEEGQHLLMDIGCLEGYTECDVIFQLNYRIPGGVTYNLGEWREVYDGEITRVNLNLTGLQGRSIEFIFTVLANGSPEDDAAFWLVPHLEP